MYGGNFKFELTMTFRNNTDLARLLVIDVSENDTTSTSNKEISINRVLGKSS